MQVDILDCVIKKSWNSVGYVFVRYHDLLLRCDIVYHVKADKLWIRMPEYWMTPKIKHSFCYWPSKQISDDFQQIVLKKISERFGHNLKTLKAIHSSKIVKERVGDRKG